jgi:hypothetical protein
MPLPLFTCPNCRAIMSLDVALADDAPRDALNAIIAAHPAGETFIKPLLRYIALFAPVKSQMSHSRLASLILELIPGIQSAQIERNGRVWPCPLDYWRQGFEFMLAQRDSGKLQLPLKSHGYLFEVLAGMADRTQGSAEARTERQRQGHAGYGTTQPVAPADALPRIPAPIVKREVTPVAQHALQAVKALTAHSTDATPQEKPHHD